MSIRPMWTEDEHAFLIANLEVLPLEAIAKKLGRSYDTTAKKVWSMGYSSVSTTLDNWSAKALAELLGVSEGVVKLWIYNQELNATRLGTRSPRTRYRITRKDFKSFYRKFRDKKRVLKQIKPEILDWIFSD